MVEVEQYIGAFVSSLICDGFYVTVSSRKNKKDCLKLIFKITSRCHEYIHINNSDYIKILISPSGAGRLDAAKIISKFKKV